MATASGNVCSNKWPPRLENDSSYESWKRDLGIWCELTDLPEEKRALAIHLSLTGRARAASSEIKVEDLKKKTGVDTLLKKLDNLFLADKGRRQFTAFHNLYNFRRSDNTEMAVFINEFEHTYYKFTQESMTLPDAVMAFMLLASCNLTEDQSRLVMSAITEVTFENMKAALKRIYGVEIGYKKTSMRDSTCEFKDENAFSAEVKPDSESYFSRRDKRSNYSNNFRTRGRSNFHRGSAGRGRGQTNNSEHSGYNQLNPVDRSGEVSRCLICDSRFHWARSCPRSYENTASDSNNKSSEVVELSLFVGYTADSGRDNKLQTLVDESTGCAVLDTGCATTVCGSQWLNSYLSELSEYQRELIRMESSNSTFTFGDGNRVHSLKRVILPCNIGGIKADITTDVVDCNIPLLLSRRSMKGAKMILDFERDLLKVSGRVIQLKSSKSGHYLLPISL